MLLFLHIYVKPRVKQEKLISENHTWRFCIATFFCKVSQTPCHTNPTIRTQTFKQPARLKLLNLLGLTSGAEILLIYLCQCQNLAVFDAYVRDK
jgi:hypothetical protein